MNFSLTFIFSEWQLSLKEKLNFFKMMLPMGLFCSGVSLIWKGILHAYNHDMYLSKTTTYIQGFYFIAMFFFFFFSPYCRVFQSNGSLPCEGGLAHTCTNTLFKAYYNRLNLFLKGFHFVVILSSFHGFLYLLNRTLHSCKSLWNNSIFLSHKCCTHLYDETVQDDVTLCKEWWALMPGMSYSW